MQKGTIFIVLMVLAAGAFIVPDRYFERSGMTDTGSEADSTAIRISSDSVQASIQASADLSRPFLIRDGSSDVTLRLKIRAPQAEAGSRRPSDVVVVLDRSGSMADENRIAFARQGLIEAARRLNAGDRIGIVTFSDQVTVVQELTSVETVRDGLERAVSRIKPQGSTFLSGGIEKAAALLRSHAIPGRNRQILLLSDGIANVGLQGYALSGLGESLGQEGIIVTAMGVGTDYDVNTFINLADRSGGGYAYVTSAERIPDAIQGELARAQTRLIDNMRIVLEPAPGVRVTQVYKYAFQQRGAGAEILAPTMAAGEEREIIVDLATIGVSTRQTTRPIAQIRISYGRPQSGATAPVERLVLKLSAVLTNSLERIAAFENTEIIAAREDIRASLNMASAAAVMGTGDYDRAVATLRTEAQSLEVSNTRLQSPSIADRVSQLLRMAEEIESRNFYGGTAASVQTMGQCQAALSAGIY